MDDNGNITIEVEIDCGMDAGSLSDVDWFMLSGISPRREKVHRTPKSRTSRLMALCSWIGMKVLYVANI